MYVQMIYGNENLKEFKNNYNSERIFLIGNGPSLSRTPLNKLDSECTLAMNRISHIYSETSWRPTIYYYAMTPGHSKDGTNERKFINKNIDEADICFIQSDWKEICGSHSNVYYFDRWWIDSRTNPFHDLTVEESRSVDIKFLNEFWSDNIENFIYHYHTMYGATQLAAYLGFDEMYFIGCDLGYEYVNPHMIFKSGMDPHRFSGSKYSYIREASERGTLLQSLVNGVAMKLINSFGDSELLKKLFKQDNDRHFTSDYLGELYISDPTDAEKELRKGHIASKRVCEDNGIGMYNATVGGELEVYERVDLEDIL